jgi:hypothetical protein
MTGMETFNRSLLDKARRAGAWIHARKSRPIRAKRLNHAQTVTTLEGEVTVTAGHYLCRGDAGDLWPQTELDLNKRYTAMDEVDAEGWRVFLAVPASEGVMAAQIHHPFEIHAKWGKLSCKVGDYVLINWQDREQRSPNDVWIVDEQLFRQTYEVVIANP